MAELTTQERLQPSLLDRLADQARFKEQLWLAVDDSALTQAGVTRAQLLQALQAHGVAPVVHDSPISRDKDGDESESELFETLAGPRALSRALDATVAESEEGPAVTVADLVQIVDRKSIPNLQESRQDRVISSKQLRGYVLRDLGWLLNTGDLATIVDMSPFPRAKKSVLNYGVPDVAGGLASEADVVGIAMAIQEAIESFEPRLRNVRVTATDGGSENSVNELDFVIEATLWTHTTPEQLFLRTELDLESADIRVSEFDKN